MMVNKVYMLVFIFSIFIASISQIILKLSTRRKYKNVFMEYLNINVILGYGLMLMSSLLTTIAYKGVPLSYGPIFNSFGYLFVGSLSWLILKEKVSKRKLLGYILIIAGIIISSISKF